MEYSSILLSTYILQATIYFLWIVLHISYLNQYKFKISKHKIQKLNALVGHENFVSTMCVAFSYNNPKRMRQLRIIKVFKFFWILVKTTFVCVYWVFLISTYRSIGIAEIAKVCYIVDTVKNVFVRTHCRKK